MAESTFSHEKAKWGSLIKLYPHMSCVFFNKKAPSPSLIIQKRSLNIFAFPSHHILVLHVQLASHLVLSCYRGEYNYARFRLPSFHIVCFFFSPCSRMPEY